MYINENTNEQQNELEFNKFKVEKLKEDAINHLKYSYSNHIHNMSDEDFLNRAVTEVDGEIKVELTSKLFYKNDNLIPALKKQQEHKRELQALSPDEEIDYDKAYKLWVARKSLTDLISKLTNITDDELNNILFKRDSTTIMRIYIDLETDKPEHKERFIKESLK